MFDPRALLLTILSLTPSYGDPEPKGLASYERRVHIAAAVAVEAKEQSPGWLGSTESLALAALTVMYEETRLDSRIHAGEPHPVWDEDKGRAKCLGQVHVSGFVPPREWSTLTGTDFAATRRCARATIRLLVSSQRYCRHEGSKGNVAITFAKYAGRGCRETERSSARAGSYARISHRYQKRLRLTRHMATKRWPAWLPQKSPAASKQAMR